MITLKVQSIAGRGKSVSEICQRLERAREERASSPKPSPPKEEREKISQTRFKEGRKLNDLKLKSVPHPLLAASIMAYAAVNRVLAADGEPPHSESAQTKSQLTAPDAQPGLANDWLRGQFNSFSNWDLGGQFRARYEHAEYL